MRKVAAVMAAGLALGVTACGGSGPHRSTAAARTVTVTDTTNAAQACQLLFSPSALQAAGLGDWGIDAALTKVVPGGKAGGIDSPDASLWCGFNSRTPGEPTVIDFFYAGAGAAAAPQAATAGGGQAVVVGHVVAAALPRSTAGRIPTSVKPILATAAARIRFGK